MQHAAQELNLCGMLQQITVTYNFSICRVLHRHTTTYCAVHCRTWPYGDLRRHTFTCVRGECVVVRSVNGLLYGTVHRRTLMHVNLW